MEQQTTAGGLEQHFVRLVAEQIGCAVEQVAAAAELLDGGATVAFVARYRKEATGGLDDAALEALAKLRSYFVDLTDRRDAILASIDEQGRVSPALRQQIMAATTKAELEDLYLPFRPKRRTRATMARERGLEPLTEALLAGARSAADPADVARKFVNPEGGVDDVEAALAGARDILAERLAEDATCRSRLRQKCRRTAKLVVRARRGQQSTDSKFRDYFDHTEPARRVPSHRYLAILRGEREGVLSAALEIDGEPEIDRLAGHLRVPLSSPSGRQVEMAAVDAYKRLLWPSIETEVRAELRERAEEEAIRVFRANLGALLMQPPFGQLPVLGLDPGLRTGCKVAAVDATGRVVATDVLFLVSDGSRSASAARRLVELVRRHDVRAVAIGNGTASRETEAAVRSAIRAAEVDSPLVVVVPETGASVYSASEIARNELPDLDVSLRGAASIARRLQDPLAELVKIDPQSLGVGQYQHDVHQKELRAELDREVEAVVNRVGVELNSASAALLQRVSGISARVATAIVARRDSQGAFRNRRQLLEVPGLGPRAFQLSAGFLRIRHADNPLDRTAVHPERYAVVEAMADALRTPLTALLGDTKQLEKLRLGDFVDDAAGVGMPTLNDIVAELGQPGRDPRPELEVPTWSESVTSLDDLQPGQILEGRVANVANFGAFVDIGVKQDGLVHISQLSTRWVDDPRSVVSVGQVVRVKVLEVDRDRGRISLTMNVS